MEKKFRQHIFTIFNKGIGRTRMLGDQMKVCPFFCKISRSTLGSSCASRVCFVLKEAALVKRLRELRLHSEATFDALEKRP
jgi:hypothetical protein